MAEHSKIEWTDHTFNPWIGCTKVSDGCKHCYAEELMDRRYGKVQWGPQGKRIRTSDELWRKPVKWNKDIWAECPSCHWRGSRIKPTNIHLCPLCMSELQDTRQRVFCASLADVFEDRDELIAWREDLFKLIESTPNLDWLLLTKRPENIEPMMPGPWFAKFPQNIWMGTTVENQKMANERILILVNIPAVVRFLSVEPLLENVDLHLRKEYVNWVICGGESGKDARPMLPAWARSVRDQCREIDVPFFFKQWGEWGPRSQMAVRDITRFKTPPIMLDDDVLLKAGKAMTGRKLDGREWNEMAR
jgi:protein gp37